MCIFLKLNTILLNSQSHHIKLIYRFSQAKSVAQVNKFMIQMKQWICLLSTNQLNGSLQLTDLWVVRFYRKNNLQTVKEWSNI